MGKRTYAESIYKDLKFCDLGDSESLEILLNRFKHIKDEEVLELKNFNSLTHIKVEELCAFNVHLGVRIMLERGLDAFTLFEILKNFKVVICDEIGAGVVPMDRFERQWRDEAGLLYQALSREAVIVDRVWAGLAMRLK